MNTKEQKIFNLAEKLKAAKEQKKALEAAVENDLNFYRSPLSVFELCAKVASLLS